MGNKVEDPGIDWNLTSWEGTRREQLRRWSALPLERMIAAIEEMGEIAQQLARTERHGKKPEDGEK
jgi:hypothetical protein